MKTTTTEWGPQAKSRTGGTGRAILAGLAGAATVTALNEVGRRTIHGAPRAELLGIRGVKKLARRVGRRPDDAEAYRLALAGDLASNALYYALVAAAPGRPLMTGAALGALAGWGARVLPPRLGLGRFPTRRSARTKRLTFGWYLAAGIAAGLVTRALRPAPPSWSL